MNDLKPLSMRDDILPRNELGADSAKDMPALTIAMLNVGEGGAQRAMVNLANHLAAQGHSIRIITAERKGTYLAHLNPSVTVAQIGPGFGRMVRLMVRELSSGSAPAILATQIKPVLAIAIARMIVRGPTRLVFRPPNRLNASATSFRHAIAKKLTPFLYRKGDAFIAVSGAIAEDLANMGVERSKIFIIPNGVNMNAIAQRSLSPVDDPWFAPGAPPVILAMGRLTWQKGFDTLLHAMAHIRASRQDLRLMILGEGELRGDLEQLAGALGINDVVRMPGFVDNPYAYLARARLFVLSSRWEGSPNALLEALACGCSVVATDCPSGPREILTEPAIGKLTAVDDPDELARNTLDLLNDEPNRERQQSFVANGFGIEQWADRYTRVIFS